MKLVAITRILNEADIVEAFVRHTAVLVHQHVFLDNGSTDATLAILASLRAEGYNLEVHHNSAVSFAEAEQNKFLFRLAAADHKADWVVPLDADEFVDVRSGAGGLWAALSSGGFDAFKVRVREYVPTPDDNMNELLIPVRVKRARPPTNNMKVMACGRLLELDADLQPGGHAILVKGNEVLGKILDDVVYAHYSIRSPWQWITKFVMGWSKMLAAGPAAIACDHNSHYREPFRLLMTDPARIILDPFFMEFCHNETGLTCDQILYLGTPLRYTKAVDHQMRAIQILMTHLERLSVRHGELAEALHATSS